jgi:tight adherence protein C
MTSLMNILAYPEFLAVALLTVILVGNRRQDESVEQPFVAPYLVRLPAMSVLSSLPARYRIWLQRQCNWAGWRTPEVEENLAAIKLVLAFAGLLLGFVIPLVAALLLMVPFYMLPDGIVLAFARRRQMAIRDALPQALDLLVLCVDAGLGLDAALQRVAGDTAAVSSALNQELATLGRDILLGMERSRAYMEMYRRTGVEELKMLGSALNQSTKLGLSIARILRAQADFMRLRQSQKAEERAAKLPVWMAFPLWFCIMPALMFVIMGPSVIVFLKNVGHVLPDWFS